MSNNNDFQAWLSKQSTMAQSAAYREWLQSTFEAGASTARKEAFEECRQIAKNFEDMDAWQFVEKYHCDDVSDAIELASKEGQNQ